MLATKVQVLQDITTQHLNSELFDRGVQNKMMDLQVQDAFKLCGQQTTSDKELWGLVREIEIMTQVLNCLKTVSCIQFCRDDGQVTNGEDEARFGIRLGTTIGYYEAKVVVVDCQMVYTGTRKVTPGKSFETICSIEGYSEGQVILDQRHFVRQFTKQYSQI